MNTMTESKAHSSKELLDALSAARDRARLQLHLLSLDARERWQELETKLVRLQSKLSSGTVPLNEATTKTTSELIRAVKDLLKENGGVTELALPASNLMKPAHACRPEAALNEAARMMWELDCGSIPVVDAAGNLVGIVTDRDICMAAYTRGQPLAALSVESVMSRETATVSPNDSLETITTLMRRRQIRRLPVVEHQRLVGIIALADIARHLDSQAGHSTVACVDLVHTLAAIAEPPATAARAAAE